MSIFFVWITEKGGVQWQKKKQPVSLTMKRTAGRARSQIDHNLKGKRTVEIIAEETGESPKQVQRYITLTNLIPELLQMNSFTDIFQTTIHRK